MANQKTNLEAFVVENYKANGEEKAHWHRVGTAFPQKTGEGFNLVIPAGVSVSGSIVLLPKKEKSE
jgi:hypothetical protein